MVTCFNKIKLALLFYCSGIQEELSPPTSINLVGYALAN